MKPWTLLVSGALTAAPGCAQSCTDAAAIAPSRPEPIATAAVLPSPEAAAPGDATVPTRLPDHEQEVMANLTRRVAEFGQEPVDPEWAPETEAALLSNLGTDAAVPERAASLGLRLVECRCSGCMLAGLPSTVRWAGHRWPGPYVTFLARHPLDSPRAKRRVRSHEGALKNPACSEATLRFQPDGGSPPQCSFSIQRGVSELCFADQAAACRCACGMLLVDPRDARCVVRADGYTMCRTRVEKTDAGLPRVPGLWSCP
jgi:hypothetical protein